MSKEAMKLARQIIWRYRHETPLGNQPNMIAHEADEAIEKIDQALAKQEQGEPVAWFREEDEEKIYYATKAWDDCLPLYTTPQQRTWVGLTDEEKKNIFLKWYGKHWAYTEQVQSVMDSVEAKLKEKNT